jgi:hypothetical protein
MTRTPGDITRRHSIADAAGGFPARATVVLYACVPPGQNEDDVTARLRRHAEARDWVVAGEILDHTTTATPLECRPNWPQAKRLITSGRATGLVTTSRTACASTPTAPVLEDWLRDHHAFLSEETPAAQGTAR